MVEEHILDLNEVRPIISSILETAQTKVIETVNTYARRRRRRQIKMIEELREEKEKERTHLPTITRFNGSSLPFEFNDFSS